MNADAKTRLFHSSNDVVDEAAKQHRREIEDEIDGDLLKDAEADCKIATSVLRALGDILAGWPALPRGVERQQEARLGRLGIKHDWRWNHTLKLWRCRACCRFSHITVDEGPPANCGACKPGRAFEREMRAYDLGHDLVACTRANAPMTLCRKCGAHGSWRWQKLLDPCPSTPPTTQVQEWLRKTLKTGQAPYQLSTRQAQSHGAAQPAKHSKRRKPRKKIPVTPKGLDALRNKLHATEADKANWNPRLCYGAGPETAPKPDRKERPVTTDLNLDNPVHGEQDGAHRRSPDAQPVQNVRPSPKADASNEDALDQAMPEVECDVCLATLLETDHACAACGWRRPYKVATLTPVGVQSARITAPPEMPTILSPSATTAETERQDQAESEPQVARATTSKTGTAPVQFSQKQKAKMDKVSKIKAPSAKKNKNLNASNVHADPLRNEKFAEATVSVPQDVCRDRRAPTADLASSSNLPWHGGTLAPPPQYTHEGPKARTHDEVVNARTKRISGYTLWVKANTETIKGRMMPGVRGLKAFGAAAGTLWKELDEDTRNRFKAAAANGTDPEEGARKEYGTQPTAAPPEVPPQPPSEEAPTQRSPDANAMTANAPPSTEPNQRRSVLDDSDAECEQEEDDFAGTPRTLVQTPQDATPNRAHSGVLSAGQIRLQALRARIAAKEASLKAGG